MNFEPQKFETYDNASLIESKLYLYSPGILKILLQDRTTGENIFWASDSYSEKGPEFAPDQPLKVELIKQRKKDLIKPRVLKSPEDQAARTKGKAEVFTPARIVNKMINYIDEEWFGRKGVFNTETEMSWITNESKIEFPKEKNWKDYVKETKLEITCGEAPFLVSRYDAVTGEIIPVKDRVGMLDRKFRVINENVENERVWIRMAYIALRAIYGYEFQGDNLIIARENILFTFIENMVYKFGHGPTIKQMQVAAEIISWNIWQMDGLTKCVPYKKAPKIYEQITLNFGDDLGWTANAEIQEESEEGRYCLIADWENMKGTKPKIIEFRSIEG